MKLRLLLLILVTWISNVTGQDYAFNCNLQQGSACTGNTCNVDGSCSCDGKSVGRNCDKDESHVARFDCAISSCQNGGTCYDSNTGDGSYKCECPESYGGSTCQTSRVDTVCNEISGAQVSVTFKITPFDYFKDNKGKIYVKGKLSETNCVATASDANPSLYTLTVDHTGGICGDADETSLGDFKRCIYLINTPYAIFHGLDYEICATCPGDTLTKKASVTITQLDNNINKIATNSVEDKDVSMALSVGGASIPDGGNVEFGARITVAFTLLKSGTDKGYETLFVTHCTVQKDQSPDAQIMDLIVDGCTTVNLYKWIGLEHSSQSRTKKLITFKAFVMQGSPEELHISCTVKVCKDAKDCSQKDCGFDVGIGRKKRQVTVGETEDKRLAQTVRVVDRYHGTQETRSGDKEEKACYMNWQMTAIIVALSVGLLLVLLLCVILVVKAILNRRGTKTVYRDDSITTSAAFTPHLAPIVSNKC